jgi:Tol biopolymer transport system component
LLPSTGQNTTVVPQGVYTISDPQWSPNGAKLVYSRFDTPGEGAASVRVVNPDGTGEQVLRLDTGAFPGRLIDVAWRGNGAILVLTQDGPENISLYELSLSSFHPAKAKLLQTVRQDGGGRDEIAYVPQ